MARRRGPQHHHWGGDDITYGSAHDRVTRARGKAALYTCSCGAAAFMWAYDHTDPNEKMSERGAFSLDVWRYTAMCTVCHKRADMARLPMSVFCLNGHRYTVDNIYWYRGKRYCKTCPKERLERLKAERTLL